MGYELCYYYQKRVVRVNWDLMDSDLGRYEINNKSYDEILALQVAFSEHLKSIKATNRTLPCFPEANFDMCILKVLKNELAYMYFYNITDGFFNEKDNCWHSILTIYRVREGMAGKCCPP